MPARALRTGSAEPLFRAGCPADAFTTARVREACPFPELAGDDPRSVLWPPPTHSRQAFSTSAGTGRAYRRSSPHVTGAGKGFPTPTRIGTLRDRCARGSSRPRSRYSRAFPQISGLGVPSDPTDPTAEELARTHRREAAITNAPTQTNTASSGHKKDRG